jgi:twitching motility protein PilT
MAKIEELLSTCRAAENASSASDVHIVANDRPWIRVNGDVEVFEDHAPISDKEIQNFYEDRFNDAHLESFQRDHYVSTSMHSDDFGDVRIHVMRTSNGVEMIIRLLNAKVPRLATLNLPKVLDTFPSTENGLYLFTGATGQGKSTALAALINEINVNYPYTIYTVEDPIEYVHYSKRSLVRQLAVGTDVLSFAAAIRSFLRADPDVILIGEMRDNETIEAALRAAETGHLVFATVHDNSASETCQRILGSFEADRQEQIKMCFSSVMRGVVSLRLLPTANGLSRIAAAEVMLANDAIRNMLRKGEYHSLRGAISQGSNEGMQTLEWDLNRLIKDGSITKEVALATANKPEEIKA